MCLIFNPLIANSMITELSGGDHGSTKYGWLLGVVICLLRFTVDSEKLIHPEFNVMNTSFAINQTGQVHQCSYK